MPEALEADVAHAVVAGLCRVPTRMMVRLVVSGVRSIVRTVSRPSSTA